MFDHQKSCRFELKGCDPRTVIVYHPLNQEDDLVMDGLYTEINRGEAALGREIYDPSAVRKKAKAQRTHMAGRVVCIENVKEPGDSITDQAEIEAFLLELPAEWFEAFRMSMRMGMSLFEGKA
jgi:hypothetical protein